MAEDSTFFEQVFPADVGETILISALPIPEQPHDTTADVVIILLDEGGIYDLIIGDFVREDVQVHVLGVYKFEVPFMATVAIQSEHELKIRIK
jgi:hypothetical protein